MNSSNNLTSSLHSNVNNKKTAKLQALSTILERRHAKPPDVPPHIYTPY